MSEKDLVIEGADAFYFGERQAACPYPDGTRECLLWLDGWEEAKYDFQRLSAFDLEYQLPKPSRGGHSLPNTRRS